MLAPVRPARVAFTLIEMMIALVITMMMVFSMVEAFRWIGDATTDGRAQIEMSGQIRAARYRLELDLKSATVPLQPWVNTEAYGGYFELIEGVGSDSVPQQFVKSSSAAYLNFNFADPNNNLAAAYSTIFGDVDDMLMFTARNDEEPFRGRFHDGTQTITIQSNLAEILWWSELNDTNNNDIWDPGEFFVIRRRVLLIRPDLNGSNGRLRSITGGDTDAYLRSFLDANDISVRVDGSHIAANSLGDLTLRHNRTAHDFRIADANIGLNPDGHLAPVQLDLLPAFAPTSNQFGEDVILTGVAAFDFRVWDPTAEIVSDAGGLNEALVPGDPGYDTQFTANKMTPTVVGTGCFLDLGVRTNQPATSPMFRGDMRQRAMLPVTPFVYDPWPLAYEKDGLNQDVNIPSPGDTLIDEGTNGLDDDPLQGTDDLGERETSPPYPYPLSALRVTIRMYEPDTRQVKQQSYDMSFE